MEETTKDLAWDEFARVDIRAATVLDAYANPKARKPAIVLHLDLGELGTAVTSAQITERHAPEDLVGRQVMCVVNFPLKNIAGVVSEVLVLGAPDSEGRIVLTAFESAVPNGSRVS